MSAHPSGHDAHGASMAGSGPLLELPPTYFNHPEFAAWLYAHIALMTIAWTVILPLGKQLKYDIFRRT